MKHGMASGNLLEPLPQTEDEEHFEDLWKAGGVRVERIVSHGHSSPEGFWYDQEEDEWVVLLSGSAVLEIEGENAPRTLQPGDWLLLPAHQRHRVAATDLDEPTIWLAVFHQHK